MVEVEVVVEVVVDSKDGRSMVEMLDTVNMVMVSEDDRCSDSDCGDARHSKC